MCNVWVILKQFTRGLNPSALRTENFYPDEWDYQDCGCSNCNPKPQSPPNQTITALDLRIQKLRLNPPYPMNYAPR